MTRARSGTKGTVSATNFSPDGAGGGEGGGAALADVGAGEGVARGDGVAGGGDDASGEGDAGGDGDTDGDVDGDGDGATLLLANDCFEPPGISILVKYRKPPTPMAARHTTITTTGHIQLGAAWAGG